MFDSKKLECFRVTRRVKSESDQYVDAKVGVDTSQTSCHITINQATPQNGNEKNSRAGGSRGLPSSIEHLLRPADRPQALRVRGLALWASPSQDGAQ